MRGVLFPNDLYKRSFFPVCLFKNFTCAPENASSDGFQARARVQMPLKLCWAWTARKSHGITADRKVVLDLEKGNAAWSVVCRFKQG